MKEIRKKMLWLSTGLIAGSLGLTAAANADQPYRKSYPLGGAVNHSNAHLIISARLHPEVEVDRSLAAQPVHPWMAEVSLGGSVIRGTSSTLSTGGVLTTYIDPLNDLEAAGLDEGHSLVRAQRLHRSLTGLDTQQLNDLRSNALLEVQRGLGASKHRIVLPLGQTELKAWDEFDHGDGGHVDAQPIMIIPKRQLEVEKHPDGRIEIKTAPMPTVPAQPREKLDSEEDDLVAQAE